MLVIVLENNQCQHRYYQLHLDIHPNGPILCLNWSIHGLKGSSSMGWEAERSNEDNEEDSGEDSGEDNRKYSMQTGRWWGA